MAASMEIDIGGASMAANTAIAVYATRPLSPSINFQPRGAYKLLVAISYLEMFPYDLLPAYEAVFGVDPLSGERVLFKARVISSDGLTAPFQEFAVDAA